jgi:hypothetical protein
MNRRAEPTSWDQGALEPLAFWRRAEAMAAFMMAERSKEAPEMKGTEAASLARRSSQAISMERAARNPGAAGAARSLRMSRIAEVQSIFLWKLISVLIPRYLRMRTRLVRYLCVVNNYLGMVHKKQVMRGKYADDWEPT